MLADVWALGLQLISNIEVFLLDYSSVRVKRVLDLLRRRVNSGTQGGNCYSQSLSS